MRQLVERHKQTLSSFLEQRRDLLLVAHASDADSVFVLQLASELDEASDEDLFIILGGEFHDPDTYALSITETFARQHELAAAAVREAQKPPLAALPPGLLVPVRPGHERLRELVAFAHELLPAEARRLVVVIAPTHISNRTTFLALIGALLPRPRRERWMSRLRLIVRDVAAWEADDGSIVDATAASEHSLSPLTPAGVSVTHVDFGQTAIRASLEAVAKDEATPMAERMQALLSSAIVDGVYGELGLALDKLERVLGYYQGEKNVMLQAVTVNAMGEACQQAGALDRARHWFECALPLAVESESALALATVAKNLGSLSFLQSDFASAEQYFDGLAQLAPKMLDNETRSWALEQRGASQAALGQSQRAIETWQEGALLCRNTDHPVGLRGHLARLSDAYARAGLVQEQRLAEHELQALHGGVGHG